MLSLTSSLRAIPVRISVPTSEVAPPLYSSSCVPVPSKRATCAAPKLSAAGRAEMKTIPIFIYSSLTLYCPLATLRDRWQCLKRCLPLCTILLVFPFVAWSQEGGGVAPRVKVLTTLESDVYAWSPDGQRLAYVAKGGIWVVEAPDLRQPHLLIRKGRGGGGVYPAPQLLWSPDGQKLAFADSRAGDGWSTIWVADADGSHVRDLLPPEAPFGSPGVRGQACVLTLKGWTSENILGGTLPQSPLARAADSAAAPAPVLSVWDRALPRTRQPCPTRCASLSTAACSRPRAAALCVCCSHKRPSRYSLRAGVQ